MILLNFNFKLLDNQNNPLPLEPYIEMGGRGIIYKKDGSQFIHIHPTGNFSMASQEVLYELKEGVEINPQELFCTFGFRNEDGKLVQKMADLKIKNHIRGKTLVLDLFLLKEEPIQKETFKTI